MIALLITLLLFAAPAAGQSLCAPSDCDATCRQQCGPAKCPRCQGGTPKAARDWTADADMVGCWFITNSATATLENECDPGTHDATVTGGTNPTNYEYTTSVPGGARSAAFSVQAKDNVPGFSVADHADFEQTAFTAGCWVDPTTSLTPNPVIPSKWTAAPVDGWYVRIWANGGVSVKIDDTADETSVPGLVTLAGGWYHLAGTWETGGEMRPYLNGAKVCSGPCTTSSGNPASTVGMQFNKWSPSVYFTGYFHECFYIGRRLTDAEMCELCTCGIHGDADFATRNALCGSCNATSFGGACR